MAKVLLVEDDNNLREIYEARLQAEGYEIASAQDGEQALVVAKQFKPDLVISDVMMPKISGFEMLDILRNTEGLEHTRVIMLTALGQAEDKTRADSLGADRYLVKSQVTLEDIVKSAHEILDGDGADVAPQPVTPVSSTVSVVAAPELVAAPAQDSTPPATPEPNVGTEPAVEEPTAAPSTAPTPTPATDPAPTQATTPSSTPSTDVPASTPSVDSTTAAPAVPTPPQTANEVVSEPTPAPEPTTESQVIDNGSPDAQSSSAASSNATNAASGTAASEQQAINKQIEDFIGTTTPDAPVPAPEPEPSGGPDTTPELVTVDDDQLLAEAANDLAEAEEPSSANTVITPTETPAETSSEAVSAPTADTTATTPDSATTASKPSQQDAADDGVTIAHKKVIQPPETSNKPDLTELLAREEAKEAGLPPAPVAVSTAAYEDVPPPPHQPGEAITPDPSPEQPQKPTDFDPNNISL